MGEVLVTELTSGLPFSGIKKERHTLKLLLMLKTGPDSSTPSGSVVGEVGRRLAKMRNRFVPQLDGHLLEHGEIKISNLLNLAGDGEGTEEETEGPFAATVDGDFYLFKVPKIGQKLICRIKEISGQGLTCSVTAGVIFDVVQFTPDSTDLYVGQRIICIVDLVTFSDDCQMILCGRLVEMVNPIAIVSSDRGSPSPKTTTLASTEVNREAREEDAAKILGLKFPIITISASDRAMAEAHVKSSSRRERHAKRWSECWDVAKPPPRAQTQPKKKVGLEKEGEEGNRDGKGKSLRVTSGDSSRSEADGENNVPRLRSSPRSEGESRGVKSGAGDDPVAAKNTDK